LSTSSSPVYIVLPELVQEDIDQLADHHVLVDPVLTLFISPVLFDQLFNISPVVALLASVFASEPVFACVLSKTEGGVVRFCQSCDVHRILLTNRSNSTGFVTE
jgi:hypothetical protein